MRGRHSAAVLEYRARLPGRRSKVAMVFVKVVVSPNGRGGKGVGRRESAIFDEIKY